MRKIIHHLKENWIRYGFETLVVISGILGAYFLNRWYEARKSRVLELQILAGLKTQMTNYLIDLKNVLDSHKDALSHSGKILEMYPDDYNKLKPEILDSIFSEHQWPEEQSKPVSQHQ